MHQASRRAFTLFQLLIVIAILAILIGVLLMAVQKVRQAAARLESMNNLKQMGLALAFYHDTHETMPAGVDDKLFSTASKLLPFIEQNNLFNRIDFKRTIDDDANAAPRKALVKTFISPLDLAPSRIKNEWGSTNYLYNELTFSLNSRIKLRDITDGTSNTIAIGQTLRGDGQTKTVDVRRQYVLLKKEDLKNTGPDTGVKYFKDNKNIAGDRCASWMDGRFLQGSFNGKLRPNDERPDVSCGGFSGVSALRSYDNSVVVNLFDGTVRSVNMTISHKIWKAAMTPNANEVLGNDWWN